MDTSKQQEATVRLRSALDALHWAYRRLGIHLGVHPGTSLNWTSGLRSPPDTVLEWLESISEPLRKWPKPPPNWRAGPASDMTLAEATEILNTLQWGSHVLPLLGLDDLEQMQVIPVPLAQWLRTISAPLRAKPRPHGAEVITARKPQAQEPKAPDPAVVQRKQEREADIQRRLAAIRQLRGRGYSWPEIGQQIGMPHQGARQLAKSHGLLEELDRERLAGVRELRKRGLSWTQVGESLGVSLQAAHQLGKHHGVD